LTCNVFPPRRRNTGPLHFPLPLAEHNTVSGQGLRWISDRLPGVLCACQDAVNSSESSSLNSWMGTDVRVTGPDRLCPTLRGSSWTPNATARCSLTATDKYYFPLRSGSDLRSAGAFRSVWWQFLTDVSGQPMVLPATLALHQPYWLSSCLLRPLATPTFPYVNRTLSVPGFLVGFGDPRNEADRSSRNVDKELSSYAA
jgi:hypothetical protein